MEKMERDSSAMGREDVQGGKKGIWIMNSFSSKSLLLEIQNAIQNK